jgi:hypothetical protein
MKKYPAFLFVAMLIAIAGITGCIKEVEDDAQPFIIIMGSNPTYLRLNSQYIDSGIMVTDNYGVSKVWIDTTQLDIRNAGRYSVWYFAEDFNGNVAKAERKVIVRIEGANLKGKWTGTRTSPYPGGPSVAFEDSLVNPGTRRIYFSRIGGLFNASIKGDLLGALGDTLTINKQIVAFNDTSTTYFNGAGSVAHNGNSFALFYQIITEFQGNSDTLVGQLEYQKQ